jgi:hypothetical protein
MTQKTATDTYVFLGPTLPVAAAQRILADAAYLPPAAVGDVYLLAKRLARRRRPVRIAIIDGYFERMAAVWHKEILDALEQGITVYGASSMGALRAAELHPYGMIGVGRVFADYRAGRLTDDDEVAVAHAPAAYGYASMSEAMVNVRAGLAQARKRGIIGARTHDTLVRVAKQQFYRERTWDGTIAAGRAAGARGSELDALTAFVARRRPDLKAADARALLRRLAREPLPARKPRPSWRMARTWFWERFTELAEETWPNGDVVAVREG